MTRMDFPSTVMLVMPILVTLTLVPENKGSFFFRIQYGNKVLPNMAKYSVSSSLMYIRNGDLKRRSKSEFIFHNGSDNDAMR